MWWKRNEKSLPKWSKRADMLLLQPSSAAAERHFIELSDRQELALKDYIETSVMLQYNSNLCNVFISVLLHHCLVKNSFKHWNNWQVIKE